MRDGGKAAGFLSSDYGHAFKLLKTYSSGTINAYFLIEQYLL